MKGFRGSVSVRGVKEERTWGWVVSGSLSMMRVSGLIWKMEDCLEAVWDFRSSESFGGFGVSCQPHLQTRLLAKYSCLFFSNQCSSSLSYVFQSSKQYLAAPDQQAALATARGTLLMSQGSNGEGTMYSTPY